MARCERIFRGVVITTTALLLVATGSAHAQRRRATPAPVEISPEERAYREAIDAGLVEYGAGRWAEARVLFLRAHALRPSARTLRGIGMCAFEMSDYVGTIVVLSEALANEVNPLEAEQRAAAERAVSQSNTFVGRIELVVEPAGATVTIDGLAPVLRENLALVNPGDHEVNVEHEGFPSAVRRVRVEGGTTVRLEIRLVVPTADRIVPDPERIRPHPVRLPSAIAYGVGGVGLGLFVGFGVRALRLDHGRETECLARGSCTESSLDQQKRSGRVADVGLGIALAATTTGLLLQLLHTEPGSERTPVVGVSAGPSSGALTVEGRF